jgi:hypothetical protein
MANASIIPMNPTNRIVDANATSISVKPELILGTGFMGLDRELECMVGDVP